MGGVALYVCALRNIFAMPVLRENRPASPCASHYKAKNPEKMLSKLNIFWILHFALLHFSRYFVVRSAWLRQSAHRLSSYKKEKIQQFASKLSLLYFPFLALLNIFASTPSRNRTCNSPLGGVCYIHLTMGANVLIESHL